MKGYAVQNFAVVRSSNGPRVVVGYVAQTRGSRISRLEVQAWSIGEDEDGNPIVQARCVLPNDPRERFFVKPLRGLRYPNMLAEYWRQWDNRTLC